MYNLEAILKTIEKAGKEILSIYQQDFQVFRKQDLSPITQADTISQQVITEFLSEHTPDIPIISEEEDLIDWEERKNWEYFWLLDPLDGTKEFIDRNGEFTINLALIHQNRPVLGLIHTPVLQVTYWAEQGKAHSREAKKVLQKKYKAEKKFRQKTSLPLSVVRIYLLKTKKCLKSTKLSRP
jgi:3'(2'), 5'-bisphosphate nucleotidase